MTKTFTVKGAVIFSGESKESMILFPTRAAVKNVIGIGVVVGVGTNALGVGENARVGSTGAGREVMRVGKGLVVGMVVEVGGRTSAWGASGGRVGVGVVSKKQPASRKAVKTKATMSMGAELEIVCTGRQPARSSVKNKGISRNKLCFRISHSPIIIIVMRRKLM